MSLDSVCQINSCSLHSCFKNSRFLYSPPTPQPTITKIQSTAYFHKNGSFHVKKSDPTELDMSHT